VGAFATWLSWSLIGLTSGSVAVDCVERAEQAALRSLGPAGRFHVETSSTAVRVEAFARGELVWAGRVQSSDCAVAIEIAEISLDRRSRAARVVSPIGEVPSLAAPAPVERPAPRFEVGAAAAWELGTPDLGRVGGAIDLGVRAAQWAARVELGAFAPRVETVNVDGVARGRGAYSTLHGLAWAEACPNWTRAGRFVACGGLGGGVEWLDAWPDGDRLFQQRPDSRVLGRADAQLSLGPHWGRAGVSGWIRVTGRSGGAVSVEGADDGLGLPAWAVTLGLRGAVQIFGSSRPASVLQR
jgi:hypothetical protein